MNFLQRLRRLPQSHPPATQPGVDRQALLDALAGVRTIEDVAGVLLTELHDTFCLLAKNSRVLSDSVAAMPDSPAKQCIQEYALDVEAFAEKWRARRELLPFSPTP